MLRTVTTIDDLRTSLGLLRFPDHTIGLVPTMGALHAGHRTLLEASSAATEFTVATIFVNPTQFGPHEDYDAYPRTLEADQALLEDAGVSLLFAPKAITDLYHPGFGTWVLAKDAESDDILCGAHRPGHFRGVLTIVAKLFNLIQPDMAFFGQKDFQQAWLIRRMARDLDMPVDVRIVPTVREDDGVALSSRNRFLSPTDRAAAPVLSEALAVGRTLIEAGVRQVSQVEAGMVAVLNTVPAFKLQYCEVRAADTLEALDRIDGEVVLAIAGFFGKTRLIDNDLVTLTPGSPSSILQGASSCSAN
ncbi:MAG: pantoate--beta-alanine ligase [bacterium]